MLFFEYPPEVNEILETGAGCGVFFPKYYHFSASNLCDKTGNYFYTGGGNPLTSSFSTGPQYVQQTTQPGEYFWCTSIYASYSENGGGALSGAPSINISCTEGKRFVDASNTNKNLANPDFVYLTNFGGPGLLTATDQKSLWYPKPFRYVFSPYTTISVEFLSPGGNSMNAYLTMVGFAQEIKNND